MILIGTPLFLHGVETLNKTRGVPLKFEPHTILKVPPFSTPLKKGGTFKIGAPYHFKGTPFCIHPCILHRGVPLKLYEAQILKVLPYSLKSKRE